MALGPASVAQSGIGIQVEDGNSTTTIQQPNSPAVINTTNNVQQINQTDPMIERHLNAAAEATASRLKEVDTKIQTTQQGNKNMELTANTLVKSLQNALAEMEKNHQQHEQTIRKNGDAIENLIQHSRALRGRNKLMEESQLKHQQVLDQIAQQQHTMSQQPQVLRTGQNESRGHHAATESQALQLQQELAKMKENNRNRSNMTTSPGGELGPIDSQLQKEAPPCHGKESNFALRRSIVRIQPQ